MKGKGLKRTHNLESISSAWCAKIKTNNLELCQVKGTAETYRDKLDVLLERAEKIDNFEAKLLRSKDKMNKIEFFEVKSGREEELWENNPILVKTK